MPINVEGRQFLKLCSQGVCITISLTGRRVISRDLILATHDRSGIPLSLELDSFGEWYSRVSGIIKVWSYLVGGVTCIKINARTSKTRLMYNDNLARNIDLYLNRLKR